MEIHVRPYVYPATDTSPEIRFFKFFRKVGPRKYELDPRYLDYGFVSKAKAEKRAREIEQKHR